MKIKAENARQYLNHLKALGIDGETFEKLSRLEKKAHRLATDYCNTGKDNDETEQRIKSSVLKLIPAKFHKHFRFNNDCRGYALKLEYSKDGSIKPPDGIYYDWGSFGIIAPEF